MWDFLELFVDLVWAMLGAIGAGAVSLMFVPAIPGLGSGVWAVVQQLALSPKHAARCGAVFLAVSFVALACTELWLSWSLVRALDALCDLRHPGALRAGAAVVVCSVGYLMLSLVGGGYWDHIDLRMRRVLGERRDAATNIEPLTELAKGERESAGLAKHGGKGT